MSLYAHGMAKEFKPCKRLFVCLYVYVCVFFVFVFVCVSVVLFALTHTQNNAVNISVNCLWPRTAIATAAISMLMGEEGALQSRRPEIMADAALLIVKGSHTGRFFIDDQVLIDAGASVEKINSYAVVSPNQVLLLFVC